MFFFKKQLLEIPLTLVFVALLNENRHHGYYRFLKNHRVIQLNNPIKTHKHICLYGGFPMLDANQNARWSLVVSRGTDIALRQFLASQGGGRKGDLSRFVEEAVRVHIFSLAAEEAKSENVGYSQVEIDAAIDEGINWARQ